MFQEFLSIHFLWTTRVKLKLFPMYYFLCVFNSCPTSLVFWGPVAMSTRLGPMEAEEAPKHKEKEKITNHKLIIIYNDRKSMRPKDHLMSNSSSWSCKGSVLVVERNKNSHMLWGAISFVKIASINYMYPIAMAPFITFFFAQKEKVGQ